MSYGVSANGVSGPAAPAELRDLFVEMNDLKRVRSAGRVGSIAERLFAQQGNLAPA